MSTAAWVMLVGSSLLLYGGLAVCLRIAVRSGKKAAKPEVEPELKPD